MLRVLKECFSINLNEYNNINANFEINKFILALFSALIVGIILLNLYRGNMKTAVTQLIRHGAKGEDNAKKLSELGLDNKIIIKKLLSRDNLLTKIVARRGVKTYEYDEYKKLSKEEKRSLEKIDFSNDSFYIKNEYTSLANNVSERYGTSVQRTFFACLLAFMVCVCIIACMPGILNVINNLLETTKK